MQFSDQLVQIRQQIRECLQDKSDIQSKRQVITNLISNLVDDQYLKGLKQDTMLFYAQIPLNEIIISFLSVVIRESCGNIIINADFDSDLIRLITQIIDMGLVLDTSIDHYYMYRKDIFADLSVVEQYSNGKEGNVILVIKTEIMHVIINKITQSQICLKNLHYVLDDNIYLNMFFIHCAKYYICKNYIQDPQVNESSRIIINQLIQRIKEGDDLTQSAQLFLQIERFRSKINQYKNNQTKMEQLLEFYKEKEKNEEIKEEIKEQKDFSLDEEEILKDLNELRADDDETIQSQILSQSMQIEMNLHSEMCQNIEKLFQKIPKQIIVNHTCQIGNVFFDTHTFQHEQKSSFTYLKIQKLSIYEDAIEIKYKNEIQHIKLSNQITSFQLIIIYLKFRLYLNYSMLNLDITCDQFTLDTYIFDWCFQKQSDTIHIDLERKKINNEPYLNLQVHETLLQDMQNKVIKQIKNLKNIMVLKYDKIIEKEQDKQFFSNKISKISQISQIQQIAQITHYMDKNLYVPFKQGVILYLDWTNYSELEYEIIKYMIM